MKHLKLILVFVFLVSLSSCSGFRDAVTGQKQKTTDEFLVKKKDPLILPPDFDKLPLPKTVTDASKKSLENVLSSQDSSTQNSRSNSNLEDMILKELRKNQ
tara:strand:+ start:391 stop:693 length:303 start_codon:yes stop_codon:yes gene_type:complete